MLVVMKTERLYELVSERMQRIIRRDTIIITHLVAVPIILFDVFKEPEATFPMQYKLFALLFTIVYTTVGLFRLRHLDSWIERKPIYSIAFITFSLCSVIVFFTGYGSSYIYVGIIPVFLAAFYYGKRLVSLIYLIFGASILAQPYVQSHLYANVANINDIPDFSFYNYALNITAYITMVALSRLVVDSVLVSNEDKAALQNASRELAQQKEQIEKIVTSMTDAIIGIDTSGIIRYSNAAAQNMLDTHKNPQGSDVFSMLEFETVQGEPTQIRAQLSAITQSKMLEMQLKYTDSSKILIQMIINPVRDNSGIISGYVLVMRDISAAKLAQEERHSYLSLLSHELRTPTATIEGMLSNMSFMIDKQSKEDLKTYVQKTHDQVLHLSTILNTLSKFVDITHSASTQKPEAFDINALAQDVCKVYSEKARAKGVAITFDTSAGSLKPVGVEEHVRSVLEVLVDNAVKYTDNGAVTVMVSAGTSGAEVRVQDTGVGIAKDNIHSVFNAPIQAQNYETRQDSGLGLGLYYAKRIADTFGMGLRVQSELGKGSTFQLDVPMMYDATQKTLAT